MTQRESSLELKRYAINAIGKLGRKDGFEPIVDAIKDKRPLIRLSASKAIGRLNFENGAFILADALLKENNQFVKQEILNLIDNCSNGSAIEAFIKVIENSENGEIRDKALHMLENKTGQKFNYDVAKWKIWHDSQKK